MQINEIANQSTQPYNLKMQYNRHTAAAILFAPINYAGGGFVHLYMLQDEGQICNFLKHWQTDTVVSKMLKIDVAWAQWQAGTSHAILLDT